MPIHSNRKVSSASAHRTTPPLPKPSAHQPKFTIVCSDALTWLRRQKDGSLPNIVTGLPDPDETGLSDDQYLKFFEQAVILILTKVRADGYCLFMNTDRKWNKSWLDKSHLIQSVADQVGVPLRWHKIVLLREVDSTHIQRPTYQHYLCFSISIQQLSLQTPCPITQKIYN